jgi:hypothetical protein
VFVILFDLLICFVAYAIVRKLVNVMKELKDAALQRPEDFYVFGVLGEPAVVFPFVMALHTLKEDFKEDLLDLSGVELFDWWDVLCELKRGLRISAEQKSQEGQPVLERLKEIYECGDFVISSLEQGVECEFQWLLCQQYTVRNMRLKEAWEIWNKMQISRPVSNEYSGENVLHILIVQGGRTNLHISKLFELVTLQRYKMSLLCAEVSADFFFDLNASCSSSHSLGIKSLLLSRVRRRHCELWSHACSFCCMHWSSSCCAAFAAPVPGQQAAVFSHVDKRQYGQHRATYVCLEQLANDVRHPDGLHGRLGAGATAFGMVAHQDATIA